MQTIIKYLPLKTTRQGLRAGLLDAAGFLVGAAVLLAAYLIL